MGTALTLLCLLLPTRSSTIDAWAYAAQVRYGIDLFLPHHLWHNPAGWLWLRLLHTLGFAPDTLAALKTLNALAYGGLLVALGMVLRRLGGPRAPVAAWLLATGSCWGLLRFATENETYILPLVASTLASAAWLQTNTELGSGRDWPRRGWWLTAGALAALGALLHQVQLWWWLGLLAGAAVGPMRRFRPGAAVWFAAPALLGWPLAYAAALPTWGLPITMPGVLRFALHDYFSGTAGHHPVAHGLLLTGIGLVRTLAQLHGYLLPLLHRWPGLGLLPLLGAMLLGFAGWRARQAMPVATSAAPSADNAHAAAVHGLVFGLNVAFAALADGNAEFMAGLPVLGAIVGCASAWGRRLPGTSLTALGSALLVWNLACGLLPLHLLVMQDISPLHRLLATQPNARLFLTDPNLLQNQDFYRSGQPLPPPQILPSPAQLLLHGPAAARAFLDSVSRAGHPIYTDVLTPAGPFDRARLAYGTSPVELLRGLPLRPADSTCTFLGVYRLWMWR